MIMQDAVRTENLPGVAQGVTATPGAASGLLGNQGELADAPLPEPVAP
jgi:hypothetical protein